MNANSLPITTDCQSEVNLLPFDGQPVFTGVWQHAWKIAWATEKSVIILGDYCILPKICGTRRVGSTSIFSVSSVFHLPRRTRRFHRGHGERCTFLQIFEIPLLSPLLSIGGKFCYNVITPIGGKCCPLFRERDHSMSINDIVI